MIALWNSVWIKYIFCRSRGFVIALLNATKMDDGYWLVISL